MRSGSPLRDLDTSFTTQPIDIQVHGTWAFARTHVTATIEVAGSGEVVPVDVEQIVIYNRDGHADGRWRIARMISNSNS